MSGDLILLTPCQPGAALRDRLLLQPEQTSRGDDDYRQ
jgi:hypothetical protein